MNHLIIPKFPESNSDIPNGWDDEVEVDYIKNSSSTKSVLSHFIAWHFPAFFSSTLRLPLSSLSLRIFRVDSTERLLPLTRSGVVPIALNIILNNKLHITYLWVYFYFQMSHEFRSNLVDLAAETWSKSVAFYSIEK